VDERVSRAFVCKRHRKFIKSHNSGFKRSIKVIKTGKHSAFRGTICNKDYVMRRIFLSTILRAKGHSGEKEYKYPKALNRKPRINVCENVSIHYAEVDVT